MTLVCLDDLDTTVSSSTVYTIKLPPFAHLPLVNGGLTPDEAARHDRQVTMDISYAHSGGYRYCGLQFLDDASLI